MVIKSIKVSLRNVDNSKKKIFFPGDTIEGICEVEVGSNDGILNCATAEPTNATVEITLRGTSKVQWTETRTVVISSGKTTTTMVYTDTFSSVRPIVDLKKTLTVPNEHQGFHQKLFSFTLPEKGLKTSFEGAHGSIKYEIEAKPPANWFSSLFKPKDALEINVMEDVNVDSRSKRRPTGGQAEKTVCCLFLKSAPVVLEADINHQGFCPGDPIVVNAEMLNGSSRKVKPYVRLVQKTSFIANGGRTKVQSKTFNLASRKDVGWDNILVKGQQHQISSVEFKTPFVPPSIKAGNIIVSYQIEIGLAIPWATTINVPLKVTIGSFRKDDFESDSLPLEYGEHFFNRSNSDSGIEDNVSISSSTSRTKMKKSGRKNGKIS